MATDHGRSEAGWTLVEVLLVLLFTGLLLSMALPNFRAARIRNNEAAAVRALRELVKAQEMMRAAGAVDEDGDGHGEYAFLQEISGERNPRTFVPAAGLRAPAPLPQFRHRLREDGEAEVCGYRFRVFLPGPGGKGVGESRTGPWEDPDPARAARTWVAYAWPLRREGLVPAATGRRTFFVSQAGEVLAADAPYEAEPPGEGSPARVPSPGAALLPGGGGDSLVGAPAVGSRGRDGQFWEPVE